MYEYRATYLKVVDGDTIDCQVDLGFGVFHNVRIRLGIVDTPERGEPGWAEATAFTRSWLEANPEFILRTEKDKSGGFGRYLGHVYSIGGEFLSKALLDNNLAVIYTR